MTRRLLAFITALCLVFSMVPAAFAAETASGTCGENLTWVLDDTGTLTISGTGAMTDYSHTSTEDIPWYVHASEITTVVVEEGVTTIGDAAFYQCSNLAELTLPSTLTSIGRYAFSYCSIAELDLPAGLLTLGNFNGNPITELVIPDSVTTISDNAFHECAELTSVVLPASLEACGQWAFGACPNLSQAVMPEMPNFKYFNGYTFTGCAFTDLSWYTQSSICYNMFANNDFVKLEIPGCVTTLEDFALQNCTALTEVTVPASVTSLGAVTFGGCTALEEVYFLGDAPELGADLVQRLTDVTFYYPADNETWTADVRNTYDGVVTWVAYDYDSGEISPDQPEDPTEPQPDYIHSGVYNGNINWSYNENSGLLRLSGAGEMPVPEDTFYPWDDYKYDYSQVDIGEDMTHIGGRCFASSTNLHEITIPGNVQHIGVAAFSHSNIRDAYIEDGVQTIGDSAFRNSYIETVQLPASLAQTELTTTFQDCVNLTAAAVPEGIETLFETFDGCTSLTEVTLPSTLRNISLSAFEGCQALTSIELPAGLETIDDYAFADTASLRELTIPSTVTHIGSEVFGSVGWYDGEEHHNGISTIYFTGDAPSFTDYSFAGYPEDHEAVTCYYPADNDTWTDDVLQQYGGNVIWVAEGEEPEPSVPTEPSEPTEPSVPTEPSEPTEPSKPEGAPDESGTWGDNLTWELFGTTLYISGKGAMMSSDQGDGYYPWEAYEDTLTHLVIEEGVTALGPQAFDTFGSLISVVFPSTIHDMGYSAFSWCQNLSSVTIPEGPTQLGEFVFQFCSSLTHIELPSTLTEITWGAFSSSGITSIVIPDSVTDIQSYAFSSCQELESVTMPQNLKNFGYQCFYECSRLTEIQLPDNLTFIPESSFSCSGLTYIEIPDSVTEIRSDAFEGCSALKAVVMPENLEIIRSNAFSGCSSLTEIVLPDTLQTIEGSAFSGSGLVSVVIPDGITEIRDFTFEGCRNLEAALIPDSVTSIGIDVFSACEKAVIYCYNLSFAHMYAEAYGIPYQVLEDEPNTPVYNIFVTCGNGGSATIVPNPSPANRYVVLEVQPDKGYTLSEVRYQCVSNPGLELVYEQIDDNTIVFFMPKSDLEFEVYFTAHKSPFKDVKESDYFFEPVLWAVSRGITAGVSATRFAPNDPCTRGQVVSFLWRAAGKPDPISNYNPFKDVKESDYYCKAVLWAVENGITSGMSPTSFGPNRPCTRGQVVAFLYRAAGGTGSYYGSNPFKDVKESDYYYDAVLWAVDNGITAGMTKTTFAPNNTCTRGQVVSFLYRFLHG